MKFEYLKFKNLIFLRKEIAFEVKQKTFFFVSQVLSFRLKNKLAKMYRSQFLTLSCMGLFDIKLSITISENGKA